MTVKTVGYVISAYTLASAHASAAAELAYSKAKALLEAGCRFSDFGTRRRRSFQAQEIVLQALVRASKEVTTTGGLSGTSNVSGGFLSTTLRISQACHLGSPRTEI